MARAQKAQEKIKELEKRIKELEAEAQNLRNKVIDIQYSPKSFVRAANPPVSDEITNEEVNDAVHKVDKKSKEKEKILNKE